MNRRGNYCDDIRLVPVKAIILSVIIVLALVLIVTAARYLIQDDLYAVICYNADATNFNCLPEAERRAAEPFLNVSLDNDGFISLKDLPQSFTTKLRQIKPSLLLVTAIVVVGAVNLIFYWGYKLIDFYLADLPLRTFCGWVILILILPVGFPFLIVSLLRMRKESKKQCRAEQEENYTSLENPGPENNPDLVECSEDAEEDYCKLRTSGLAKYRSHTIEELKDQIDSQKRKISHHGNEITRLQRKLGQTTAELNHLQSSQPDQAITPETARSEWRQILSMRGVSRIEFRKDPHTDAQSMVVFIDVRVLYGDKLYDFGDYEVTLAYNTFECKLLRSGVKPDSNKSRPMYSMGARGFCFGSREHEIQGYANSAQFVESLTLVVDCLHSVNPRDKKRIPDYYREIATIKPIEQ